MLAVSSKISHKLHDILTTIPDLRPSHLRLRLLLPRPQPKSNVSKSPSANIRHYQRKHLTRKLNSNESYGWHFQYLTIIGLALSTLTFAFGLLADITLSRRLFAVKNALSVASAPIECLISILYWGLRAVSLKRGKKTPQSTTRPFRNKNPILIIFTDRHIPRPPALGPRPPPPRRLLLPPDPRAVPRPRPPVLLAALHHRRPPRPRPLRVHRFRLLVLDRAVLRLQPVLPLSDLRRAEHARTGGAFCRERGVDGGGDGGVGVALWRC